MITMHLKHMNVGCNGVASTKSNSLTCMLKQGAQSHALLLQQAAASCRAKTHPAKRLIGGPPEGGGHGVKSAKLKDSLGLHIARPGRDLNRLRIASMDMGMPSRSRRST